MRILIYGSTYLTELCVNQLIKDGYNLVGYIPSENPTFEGVIKLPKVNEGIEHDIKLSIQYDKKIDDHNNAYNLHTGLLPDYGGTGILYYTILKGIKEQGLTFHKMTEKFDEGGVISKMTYSVLQNDTVKDLYMRMCVIAPKFLSNALKIIQIQGEPQKPTLFSCRNVPEDVSTRDTKEIRDILDGKNCKVISICLKRDGDVRTNVNFPAHNQDVPTSEKMLELVKELFYLEINQDAGCPVDIYFVNNDVGFKEGNDWLNSINGTKTKNGTLYVLHRENVGGAFGAYDFAFQKLKDKYKYFLFTEEDLFIFGKDYYSKALNRYNELGVGFLAFIDVERRRNPIHAHGGVGLVSRKVLEEVCDIHKCLPHSEKVFDKTDVIRKGEILFTNTIHKLGYELARMGEIEGWDEKNYLLPYFNYRRHYNVY